MSHELIGLLKTTIDSNLVSETFVFELLSPIASVLEVRLVRCVSHVKCYLHFRYESDAKNVILALDGRQFSWGTFQFARLSGMLSAENDVEPRLVKLPTDTSINKKLNSVTQFGISGVSFEPPNPPDLVDDQLSSELCEGDYLTIRLPKTNNYDLRRISTQGDYCQNLQTPLLACEPVLHPIFPLPAQSNPPSKVITIKNFDTRKLTAKSLANLFGSMGNVRQVVLSDPDSTGFVEFEMETDTQKSMQFIQNLPLFGHHITISKAPPGFSLEQYIQSEQRSLQVHKVQSNLHRYRNFFGIRVNPLSNILHLTNIDDRVDPVILYAVISAVEEPETLYLLRQRSLNSRMFLVKFKSAPCAAAVLAVLHNKQLGNRNLKISFSKMKV